MLKTPLFHSPFLCYRNVTCSQDGECKTQNINPGHFFLSIVKHICPTDFPQFLVRYPPINSGYSQFKKK